MRHLTSLKPRLLTLLYTTVALLMPAALALGADEEKRVDARLEGFTRSVKVEGSVTMTWILFIVLTIVCVSVLFKSANRSHLD